MDSMHVCVGGWGGGLFIFGNGSLHGLLFWGIGLKEEHLNLDKMKKGDG